MSTPTEPLSQPCVSIVVPVRNDPVRLEACLAALSRSDYPNYEVLVVDDASTDETAAVAEENGAQVIRLERQSGPAKARNRGVAAADGSYVLFVDADVLVTPHTISQFVNGFQDDSMVAAIFGSYDEKPSEPHLISQFKNLVHHYVHQHGHRNASTFWAGCGAMRRAEFLEFGGFEAQYGRPCIEDIELGVRLHKAGRPIVLEKEIQVTHLKRWTFWGMLKTDIFDRAVPWSQLILQERSPANDLNLKASQRVSAILSCALLAVFLVGAWFEPWVLAAPFAILAAVIAVDRWRTSTGTVAVICAVPTVTILVVSSLLAYRFEFWTLIPASILLAIVWLNRGLFQFFARVWHPLFAVAALPLQLLYYVYSTGVFGVCFLLDLAHRVYRFRRTRRAEMDSVRIDNGQEIGLTMAANAGSVLKKSKR